MRRSCGAGACWLWQVWWAEVIQSSGAGRYRVDWVCREASKAGSRSMGVWMVQTSWSGVSASDTQGVAYARWYERDMSYLRRGGTGSVSDWSQCHGIRVVSCLGYLEAERSSGRPVNTISKCYKTCFRWWCDSGCSWQWLSDMEQLCFSGWTLKRVWGMMKGSHARKRILLGVKAV